jgi:hypothetical protein
MDGVSDSDIASFMNRLDQGLRDSHGVPTGEFYTFSTRKASEHEISRWVGDLVMSWFKIDEMARATEMIKAWKKNKRLVEGEYWSERQRKKRACVHSDLWKADQQPMEFADGQETAPDAGPGSIQTPADP